MRRLILVVLCGCGPSGTGTLALSWQFADGRLCPDTGAAAVDVQVGGGKPQEFFCDQGLSPASVNLDGLSRDGVKLQVTAVSTEGAPLYSGHLSLDALPSFASVTLYADEMR